MGLTSSVLKTSNRSSVYASNLPHKRGGNALLLIDPQNDFCDPKGSLFVENADADCGRLANFIEANLDNFNEIYVSLDTHMIQHIAHPAFWTNDEGEHPEKFTEISHAHVLGGAWFPTNPDFLSYATQYTKDLEAGGKFKLTIWPPHCLLGTTGHAVEPRIASALAKWETQNGQCVHYVLKGHNSLTEHYSALKAEVEISADKNTKFNTVLYKKLISHDRLYVGGQARDFCVKHTVTDLLNKMNGNTEMMQKVTLLANGMSDVVPGQGQAWYDETVAMTSPAFDVAQTNLDISDASERTVAQANNPGVLV